MKKTKTVASNFVHREDGDRQLRSSQNVASSILHHRALLSLPQSSYSTNTSSSRASLNCLCQCDTECPAMACIAVYCSCELFPIPVT